MKNLIFTVFFILISLLSFSQTDEVDTDLLIVRTAILGYVDGTLDSLIVQSDSTSQWKYQNMADPVNDLDGVNKRTLDDLSVVDSMEYFLSDGYLKIYKPNGEIIDSTLIDDSTIRVNNDGLTTHLGSLQEHFAHLSSPYIALGGEATDIGSNQVAITTGETFIKETNDLDAVFISVSVPSDTFTIAADQNIVLYIDYNGGSPLYRQKVSTGGYFYANWDETPFATVVNIGTSIIINDFREVATNGIYKNILSQLNYEPIRYLGGLATSEVGTRQLSVTAGALLFANDYGGVAPLNTSTSGTFTRMYVTSGAWTRTAGQTTVSNSQYNDITSGLVTLSATPERWANKWLYYIKDSPSYWVLLEGQTAYTTEQSALDGGIPSTLPPELSPFYAGSLVVAQITVSGNQTNIVAIQSPFEEGFTSSPAPTSHNDLTGIQGGAVGDYFHLRQSELTKLQDSLTADDELDRLGGLSPLVDNTLIRADGTDGTMQSSGATIDDSDNLTANNLSGTNTGDVSIVGSGDYLTLTDQELTKLLLDTLNTHINSANWATFISNNSEGVSFGSQYEIPFMNAGGTDFDYSSSLYYASGKMYVPGIEVAGSIDAGFLNSDTWVRVEDSNPGTPSTGGVYYTKSDGFPYFKNDSGTEYDLSTGSGGAKADSAVVNLYYGTSWLLFGGSSNSDLVNYYPAYTIERVGFVGTVTEALGGATIASQLAILKARIASDPTYLDDYSVISLNIGFNDFAGDTILGNRNSVIGDGSFAGDLKDFIETTLNAREEIKLFIITPQEANTASVPYNGLNSAAIPWSIRDLSVLQAQISSDYAVQCIDAYSLVQWNLQTIADFTIDGIHPNSTGAKFMGYVIGDAMMSGNNFGKPVDMSVVRQLTVSSTTSDTIPALGEDGGQFRIIRSGVRGLLIGEIGSGNVYFQAQRTNGVATAYDLLLNPNGGDLVAGDITTKTGLFNVGGDVLIYDESDVLTSLVVGGQIAGGHQSQVNWRGKTSGGTPINAYWRLNNTGIYSLSTQDVVDAIEVATGSGETTFAYDVGIDGALKDSDGDAGTSGQVFSSTVTGTNWINAVSGSKWTDGGAYIYPTNDEDLQLESTSPPQITMWNTAYSNTSRYSMGANAGGTFSINYNNATNKGIELFNDGQVSFPFYGSGTYTGTAAYNLEVDSNGDIIETTAGSDFRIKKNFRTLNNSLSKVLSINTYAFDWIPKDELPKQAIDTPFDIKVSQDYIKRQSSGVIAQEIIDIIPEAVTQYNNGYYKVDYEAIVPHLIEAIKEQQKQINELQLQINKLN